MDYDYDLLASHCATDKSSPIAVTTSAMTACPSSPFLALLSLALSTSSLSAQQQIGCFVQGECKESAIVSGRYRDSPSSQRSKR